LLFISREIFGFLGTLPHELGIASLGHRRKLLDAIVALRSETSSAEIEYRSPGAQCSPPEDRAERRQVTVIFSDLVGSTALSTRKDPEDLREVISTFGEPVPALRLYWVGDSINPRDQEGGKSDCGHVVSGEAIVSCSNAPPVFELAE
jgi:hypothetical protein